jgi:hypothetical protein
MDEAMSWDGRTDSAYAAITSAGTTAGAGAIVTGASGGGATGGAPDCARCC